MRDIPGLMNWASLMRAFRAEPASAEHAPRDRRECVKAALDLRERGLGIDDIATALRLSRPAVRELLRETLPAPPPPIRRRRRKPRASA